MRPTSMTNHQQLDRVARRVAGVTLAVFAALAAGVAATVTAGDEAQRIQFAPDTDNATVQGSTAPGTTDRWVLGAEAGQTMTVSFGPDEFAALTTLFGPDGDVVAAWHTGGSATLPETGDYIIDVGNTGSTNDYTMTVRIPALPATTTTSPPTTSPPAPSPTDCEASTSQRIQFAPGTDNASVHGSIAPGSIACYVLRVSAGQTMTVSFGPDEFAALTTLFGPDGDVVAAWHTGGSATLAKTGDYIIDVGNTGNTNDFTMTVRIPAATITTTTTTTTTTPPTTSPGRLPATL
jgi:hypothetical protein